MTVLLQVHISVEMIIANVLLIIFHIFCSSSWISFRLVQFLVRNNKASYGQTYNELVNYYECLPALTNMYLKVIVYPRIRSIIIVVYRVSRLNGVIGSHVTKLF